MVVKRVSWMLTLVFCTLVLGSGIAAQDRSNLGDIYKKNFLQDATYNNKPPANSYSIEIPPPLELQGGSTLSLLYPAKWRSLAEDLKDTITISHTEFSEMFGEIPSFSSSVRLMDEETFYLSTGAPSWTNALFYKGQILIPVPDKGVLDRENIIRSVKHEYTHAVISALSGGRCPGWLDEGLAQWAEGEENPALRPALARYLMTNRPVSLSLLQTGFTKLETRMVPAAYAQSLFATQTMISSYGLSQIGDFFKSLRDGEDKGHAFSTSFKVGEQDFESHMGHGLNDWAKEHVY